MAIAFHITHESARKIGGIGAVLNGVCTLQYYKDYYERTIFYGPLFELPSDVFGKSGKLLYSSHDNFDTANFNELFSPICQNYGIDIVYGQRELASEFDVSKRNIVEVINVSINKMKHQEVERFKYNLWKNFNIKSHLYEHDWDYEQYLRIAIPYPEIIDKLCGENVPICHFAHEYMGVPSALAILLAGKKHKTIFVAHEVTTARTVVEDQPGADISFYNVLKRAKENNSSFEQIYGSHEHHSRTELIKRAVNFDNIFVVGDHVKEEYLFLVPQTPPEKIKVVYNGVSTRIISFDQKERSRKHLQKYIETLFNFAPDIIFTHVTRLIISKGIWRDISMLYHLDDIFAANNLKGAYILLSSLITVGRASNDIFQMEFDYGWPVLHRQGWPDLIGEENRIYEFLQLFNSRSKAIKGVFINQFGLSRTMCGNRVPENMEFEDIRIGSDAELGFSTYEPFGIAQIETIPFGGVALMSSSCGSASFLEERFADSKIKPFYILDYISAAKNMSLDQLRNMSMDQRNEMENNILNDNAKNIFDILPLSSSKREEYLANAQNYIPRISWEASATDYILPV